MRINPAEKIAGLSPLAIRKLLHRAVESKWGVAFAAEVLGISTQKAKRVLKELEELGYIEKAPDKEKVFWKNTEIGNHLAVSRASKPISRATAERKLGEFLGRVKIVRDDPYYLYRVERVTLFGSILSDKASLGDVDIAIRLIHKEPDPEKASALDRLRSREAEKKGRRFNTFLDFISWPKYEIFLFLKARSTSLSLGLENESFLQKCETKVVYQD